MFHIRICYVRGDGLSPIKGLLCVCVFCDHDLDMIIESKQRK